MADELLVTSWNIAAINNNPWEYWVTYDENPKYTKLMEDIEEFIENPKEKDVTVETIFTQDMYNQLLEQMKNVGWQGLDKVTEQWEKDYKGRKIISEFLKDKSIGSKRLTSMPDRFTNTISLAEPEGAQICRPSVINVYEANEMSSISSWFDAWIKFIFENSTTLKKNGDIISKKIYELFTKIQKSKYPAISVEEEEISIPLQVVCLAIFDCILLHMMINVSGNEWIAIKDQLCEKLNKDKVNRTCNILDNTYGESSIVALQECGAVFLEQIKKFGNISHRFNVFSPANMDTSRDQNSVILLNSTLFNMDTYVEHTDEILEELRSKDKKAPVVAGDLFVISIQANDTVKCKTNKFLLASFHGDTNGLATIPVVEALCNVFESKYSDHCLIFCLDANTYEKPITGQQGVVEFAKHFCSRGLSSCFGDEPDPSNYTTFNARTYLQPQLNKACKSSEKTKGDINPKDFILFSKKDWSVHSWHKDNTGNRNYIENIVFPTLTFPSDHGILYTTLRPHSD